MHRTTGLLLSAVEPNSPAEQGALLLGDTLIALDDTPVRHPDDLLTFFSTDRIGTTVRMRIGRGGQVQGQTVGVGERPWRR